MTPDAAGKSRSVLVRETLLLDDSSAFAEELAKAGQVLRLDSKGGVHPTIDLSKYSNRQKIELVLLGKRMACIGEILKEDTAEDSEIAKYLGIPLREVQKRAHDLRAMGRIEATSAGLYRLVEGRVLEILRDLGVQ